MTMMIMMILLLLFSFLFFWVLVLLTLIETITGLHLIFFVPCRPDSGSWPPLTCCRDHTQTHHSR